MAKGTIKKLMERGFGFINAGDEKDLFFHRNDVEGVEFHNLKAIDPSLRQQTGKRPPEVNSVLRDTAFNSPQTSLT